MSDEVAVAEACDLVRTGRISAAIVVGRVLDDLSVAVAAVANLFAPPRS